MTSTIKSNRAKAVNVSGTITRTSGAHTSITAPTQSGYSFVSWVNISTGGWVGGVYIEDALLKTTNVWAYAGVLNGAQGGFTATALYQAD